MFARSLNPKVHEQLCPVMSPTPALLHLPCPNQTSLPSSNPPSIALSGALLSASAFLCASSLVISSLCCALRCSGGLVDLFFALLLATRSTYFLFLCVMACAPAQYGIFSQLTVPNSIAPYNACTMLA